MREAAGVSESRASGDSGGKLRAQAPPSGSVSVRADGGGRVGGRRSSCAGDTAREREGGAGPGVAARGGVADVPGDGGVGRGRRARGGAWLALCLCLAAAALPGGGATCTGGAEVMRKKCTNGVMAETCIGYDRLANAQTCNIYTGCTTYDTSADAQWRWADVTGAAAVVEGCAAGTYKAAATSAATPAADGCAAGTYQAAATSEATRVCGSFAVHARVSVNFNGGQSTVHGGDVGVSPGTVVDGTYVFEGGGSVVDASDGVFANKVLDEHAAAIAARADGVAMASEIGGVTFTPGTYRSTTINLAAGT
ncbi:hypothetical protein T484DRAFT_1759491, partial [Baffinella frigidus]